MKSKASIGSHAFWCVGAVCLVALLHGCGDGGKPNPTPSGELVVRLPSGASVALSTVGYHGRVRFNPDEEPIATPMVDPSVKNAEFSVVESPAGISWNHGKLLVSDAGELILQGPDGVEVTRSSPLQGGDSDVVFSSRSGNLYGRGAGPTGARTLAARKNTPYPDNTPFVDNRQVYVPHYWSTDGYVALGVVPYSAGNATLVDPPEPNFFPANFSSTGLQVTWSHKGAFELYLVPAADINQGTSKYYDLIGKPSLPPRYAFGFIASRWGWHNRSYIESVLHDFRNGSYPADVFITDFGWFTNVSDYAFAPEGEPWYHDFEYWNVTFPQPVTQLSTYRDVLNFRMGGIRKPRLGNTAALEMARSKGWLLPGYEFEGKLKGELGERPYAHERCLNFSIPAVRDWYAAQQTHYLRDGVSFFWNDEGETDYFTFYWWNVAQHQTLSAVNKSLRFYSMNRAWSPGSARLGATVWTGDSTADWDYLQQQPGMLLNWALAGSPYVACDIGGFFLNTTGLLLTRWYQVGVFMPTMRVHSIINATPHFPWLWKGVEDPLRQALNLRYQLVPYHYSLAQRMATTGSLWMRPLYASFPDDPFLRDLTDQWFDGDLLVAPVMNADNTSVVYLPEGTWFRFNTSKTVGGGVNVSSVAAIDEIPVFVAPGSIVTLGPVVQSTVDLPGGPLEVQVYGGASGTFTLYEDDGETVDTEVKVTVFDWNEAEQKLSWVTDATEVPNMFRVFSIVLFRSGSRTVAGGYNISQNGSAVVTPEITV